ncbi:CcmD family protein [Phaeodactylibacter luteus]|uniref:CcmD family protein n=1 Tax=Phaeodactylibacter luteus TaxID=1564516 RepID=A0A5C6RL70_9BACT|nr:CcmD family protein [Phaeodactylibacter luteus]TXB62072.1 CcmD family protein [Phaeodactylibacter luteus]
MKKRFSLALLSLCLLNVLAAQNSTDTDFMRSTGKIYVVVAVVLAIFVGLVLFLVYLDRKLTKLENQIKDND